MRRGLWSARTRRRLCTGVVAGATWLTGASAAQPLAWFASADAVPAQAVALYQKGLAEKRTHPDAALQDFAAAARLAPRWEAPVYEEGALLAVRDFVKAVPVLLRAARLNPKDEAVWNVLGWGYYQQGRFQAAESAFRRQLQVDPASPYAIWGLANCEANAKVRAFAKARVHLTALLKVPALRPRAAQMLAKLPPDAVDAHVAPNDPVRVEDAIAMLLSYRSDILPAGGRTAGADAQAGAGTAAGAQASVVPRAADGRPASTPVVPYIAWAVRHHLIDPAAIPSFHQSASRLFLALLLAKYYGLNAFSYVRPFPLTDMQGVPVDQQMVVNSVIANRLMAPVTAHAFQPQGTMTRAAFAAAVAHANQVMAHPPQRQQWLTPPPPVRTAPPWLLFFNTSDPPYTVQQDDLLQHKAWLDAVGFTAFPFYRDLPAGVAAVRRQADGTSWLATIQSAAPAEAAAWDAALRAGVAPYLVLGNYSQAAGQPDPALVEQLLATAAQQQAVVAEVVQVAKRCHAAGVVVDFENLPGRDRTMLTAFVRRLHAAAQQAGLSVLVCLPERDTPDVGSAYDYAALGAAADRVMLITYDEHTPGSRPGPVSDWTNTDRVIKYALQEIPAGKLLVGAAAYGYDWRGSSAAEVSMAQAQQLARAHGAQVRWEARSQTPWFTYTDAKGQRHTVWFEDARSIAAVARLVQTYGLAGMAVWHLGAEDASFWQAVQAAWAGNGQTGRAPGAG